MHRKYVILKGVNDEMVELAFNRIFDDKVHADRVCDAEREDLIFKAMEEGNIPHDAAFSVAKSFIKVYELVAVDL